MQQRLSLLLSLGYFAIGQGILFESAIAQVAPDGTTNTTVDVSGNNFTIEQGDRAGDNLFHSFSDFSVPTDGSAFFNNAADIVNIFSRVTGGNISNIDGLLGANGAANLFLINPAGIIFGAGARLDLGGSFYGSTADRIVFPDGEFSATDLANPPLLTINAPIGLNFRDNPGDITVRGDGLGTRLTNDLIDTENALQVNESSTLGLVGGNLNLEGATLKTPGGRIELGSVAGNEQVSFTPVDEGFSLVYEGVENFGNIQLSQTATVDARGLVSGDIRVQGNNITLIEGSQIEASTVGNLPSDLVPGIVELNAVDTITIDNSGIFSQVYTEAVGDGGEIAITTENLNLTNGGFVSADTLGQGNAGSINITTGNLNLTNGGFVSTDTLGQGNAGSINITTGNLNLTNGGFVSADTLGQGNAGSINITASDTTTIDDSLIVSVVSSEAVGEGGSIAITTGNLNLTNGGQVSTSTFGQGNAGSINITASDTITIDGVDSEGFSSSFNSVVTPKALGDAGKITITTGNLNLTNGGQVIASTAGQGNAGDLTVNAKESIIINGVGEGTRSGLLSNALVRNGNAGNINVITNNLNIDDGGTVTAGNFSSLGFTEPGTGQPGNINIQANSLSLTHEARINAATQSETGNTANINLQLTGDLTLRDNSFISARALENANGGNLTILQSRFILGFPSQGNGNDLIATAERGIGGNIAISTRQIFNLQEGRAIDDNGNFIPNSRNDIDVSSLAEGLAGTVTIFNPDTNTLSTDSELPNSLVESEQTLGEACRSTGTAGQPRGLTLKGKGGVPPAPTEPFDSETILVDEPHNISPRQTQQPEIKPIKTSIGDIYPARGVIKTVDGKIILTAYATDNLNNRTPNISANCSLLR